MMINEHTHKEQPAPSISHATYREHYTQRHARTHEHVFASFALLLGAGTDYTAREQACRRLIKLGPAILPLFISTLSRQPEITSPSWPHWPPQYEPCSRLLLHLCQQAGLPLYEVVYHPALLEPAGPVLWITVIEAMNLASPINNETFFCQALLTQWETVRYAAAMALAQLAGTGTIQDSTLSMLHMLSHQSEPLPVQLALSYALLRSNHSRGIDMLIQLLEPGIVEEGRKAAAFILAAEPPTEISAAQREQLIRLLFLALQSSQEELVLHTTRALRNLALPSTLTALETLLTSTRQHVQIAGLMALEEIAHRKTMRQLLLHHPLTSQVAALLRSEIPDLRRQAAYTLANIGGEYAIGILGSIIYNINHICHQEALGGVRLLHGALRQPLRSNIVRWLLHTLQQTDEDVLITTLDSLIYLLWQARSRSHKQAFRHICQLLTCDESLSRLLANEHALIRQRTIELISMLSPLPENLYRQLTTMLHRDSDTGIRACIAYHFGQMALHKAVPDLIQALLDPDDYVAETAFNTLSHLGSGNDEIMVYIMRELTGYLPQKLSHDTLASHAHKLLKKWRKPQRKTLHSS